MTSSEDTPKTPSPPDEGRKRYAEFLAEVNRREISASENFDKSILTLSSAGLGLSVGFLKDVVPFGGAVVPWLAYFSWILFSLATMSTMTSFLVTAKAIMIQRPIAYRGLVEGDLKAFEEKNAWRHWITPLNVFSAVTFLAALVCTVVFIVTNLEHKRILATSDDTRRISIPGLDKKGVHMPDMQKALFAPATTSSASAPSTEPSHPGGRS